MFFVQFNKTVCRTASAFRQKVKAGSSAEHCLTWYRCESFILQNRKRNRALWCSSCFPAYENLLMHSWTEIGSGKQRCIIQQYCSKQWSTGHQHNCSDELCVNKWVKRFGTTCLTLYAAGGLLKGSQAKNRAEAAPHLPHVRIVHTIVLLDYSAV